MAKRGRKRRGWGRENPVGMAAALVSAPDRWAVPARLTEVEAEAWRHLVTQLGRVGNLERTDPLMVEAYAVNVGLLRAAQADLAKYGATQEIRAGRRGANPAAGIANTATLRIGSICSALGLVPATAKYAAETRAEDAADDPMARLLKVSG